MKSIFRKIFTVLNGEEKKRFYALVVFNTLVSIADILSLALMVFVIVFYTQRNLPYHFVFLPAWLADPDSISLILIFFILFTIKSIAGYFSFHAQFRYVYNVSTRLSANNLSKYLEGSYTNYVNVPPAAHVRHISDHTIQFGHYVLFGMLQMITDSILVFITVIGILLFNAKLFFVLLIILLPPVVLVAYYTKKKLRHARTHVKETSESSLQYLQEALHGYVESNIYHKSQFFIRRFIVQQKNFNKYLSDVHIVQGLPTRLVEVFAVLGLLILIAASKFWGTSTTTEIINIGAFMAVAYKLIPGIVKVSNTAAQLKTYEFIVDDMLKDANTYNEVETGAKKINTIEFKDVLFSHNKGYQYSTINLDIKQGELIGISGDSGKGKTTLINLLLGFLNAESGSILINGMPVSATERQEYLNDIAYVKQQAFLIHDTLFKNITLDEDDYNKKRLDEVLHASGLTDIMSQWPEGINKVITDNGKNISGGQRQRIAIARALYKDAGVIILDEPFNELDTVSEQKMLAYFKRLAEQNHIVILVTHNSNSLAYCDKIISV